jgi:hypothetical protein
MKCYIEGRLSRTSEFDCRERLGVVITFQYGGIGRRNSRLVGPEWGLSRETAVPVLN